MNISEEDRRNNIAKILGQNLFKLRKEKGFTREELAEKSNLSSNYIYGLETGTYLPGCLALIDLSNALDVTPTDLLSNYIENKENIFIQKISSKIKNLSSRDLELIQNIIDFCEKK